VKRLPLVRVASIIPMRDFLLRMGAALERVLDAARLTSRVFAHPELLLPYPVVARFFEEAAGVGRDETLGARVGHETRVEALGVFGRRIANASTLGEALAIAARVAPAYFSGQTFWLAETGPGLRLCHRFPTRLDDRDQQIEQFSLCIMLRLLKSVAAPDWRPIVHLKKGMPPSIADLPMLRDGVIVFDEPTWAIAFPRSLLGRSLPAATMAPPQPLELDRWRASAPGRDFASAVAQVIGTAIACGDADIDLVATWIGTSTRTLQRRLEDDGVSYAQLFAKARLDSATDLLENRGVTLQDIARTLGYSDPAHFTRAFRRWTGCSPRAYRDLRANQSAVLLVLDGVHEERSSSPLSRLPQRQAPQPSPVFGPRQRA
jgi:AraC-like DNA-binding protein